jgi:glycerophosphoryl diester phosphodiesterase
MPAFGAAVAMGADEIEFDLWSTSDGALVTAHDSRLERVSNGEGRIWDHTLAELKALDFGSKFDEKYKDLRLPTFEEILKKLGGRVIMNIHVKIWDVNFENPMIEEIVALVRKYDCVKHIYFMTASDAIIKRVMEYAPDMRVCVGWDGNKDPMSIVDRAIELGAYKVQLFKPYFNREMIDKAHDNGLICNAFWSDDAKEAKEFLDMGIDTILTNDYHSVAQCIKKR